MRVLYNFVNESVFYKKFAFIFGTKDVQTLKSNKQSVVAFWFNWEKYAALLFKITCTTKRRYLSNQSLVTDGLSLNGTDRPCWAIITMGWNHAPVFFRHYFCNSSLKVIQVHHWMTDYLSLRRRPEFFNLRLRLRPPNFISENFHLSRRFR